MSDLLNSASLVMIPSGYKEDIVYSEVPTNGNGDLSFTRASNGTRINSAGLVEVVPWNAMSYSNTFTNGVWVTSGYGNLPTLTANSIANPVNGLVDAWTASFAAAGTQGRLLQTFTGLPVGVPYTFSIYIKAGTKTIVTIMSDTASIGLEANFNLSTGVVTSASSGVTATITAMTNGWYFLTMTNNILSNGNGQYGIVTGPGDDGSLYIYGAQVNIGSTAKPYFPTTDRLNVPRLTYQNGGGGCPSLLLEKQSTNLVLQSENWGTYWVVQNISASVNQTTSPDGTTNADLLTTTNTGICYTYQYLSGTSGAYSTSVFVKNGNNNFFALNVQNASTQWVSAIFDLSDGSLGEYAQGSGGAFVYTSHTITSVGDGWYRCVLNYTTTQSTYICPMFAPLKTGNSFTSSYGEVDNNANNKTLYIWGAQLEASSYPTSYIPTTSASATRVADVCTKTGIGALIGGTSGTVFFDIKTNPVLSSESYKQFCYYFTSGGAQSYMYLGSTNLIVTNSNWASLVGSTAFVANTRYKVALVYAPNDFALYVNGVSVATASSGTPLNNVDITIGQIAGGENCEFVFNQYTHFPSRLTNAELASLTTI